MPEKMLTDKFTVFKQISDNFKGDQFYCIVVGEDDGIVETQVTETSAFLN